MSKSFGIIGLGLIADMHANALKALGEKARLTACLDIDSERVNEFSNKYLCAGYTDIDEFLRHEDLDIVTVCTPSGLHMDSTLAAIDAGKHVVVEKPLEITLKRCDRIIEAGKEKGVKVCGIFPSRFHEVSQIVKKAIEEGRFGKIVMADAYVKWFREQAYYDSSGWKGTWALDGGGALMNQSIHAIDLLQWFIGPVSEIVSYTGTLGHERIEVEDTAVAALRFRNGALGVIEGSTSAFPGFMKRIEICGSEGSVVMEEEDIVTWQFREERPEDESIRMEFSRRTNTGGGAADPSAIGYHGHQFQFENMIDAIETNAELLVDGKEARKAVEIIRAIYRSSEKNRPVTLPLR